MTDYNDQNESPASIRAQIRDDIAALEKGEGEVPAWMTREECIADLQRQLSRLANK